MGDGSEFCQLPASGWPLRICWTWTGACPIRRCRNWGNNCWTGMVMWYVWKIWESCNFNQVYFSKSVRGHQDTCFILWGGACETYRQLEADIDHDKHHDKPMHHNVTIGWRRYLEPMIHYYWRYWDSDLISIIPGGVLTKRRMAAPGLCQGSQGAVWILGWTILNNAEHLETDSEPQNLNLFVSFNLYLPSFFSLFRWSFFLHFAFSDLSFWDWDAPRNRVYTPKLLVSLPVQTKPGPCSERPWVYLAGPLPRYVIQL